MAEAELATEWMIQLVDELGGNEIAETQSIPWIPEEWNSFENDRELPAEVAQTIRALRHITQDGGITREHVRAVGSTCGEVGLFTASMIWGMKPGSYGPYRLRQMLTTPRHGREPFDVITEIVQTAKTQSAAEGFGSLWTNGSSRVFRLGTAFGTKVLYFAAEDTHREPLRESAEAPPLILDQFVYLGAQRHADIDPEFAESVHDPRKYMSRAMYANYCQTMFDRAARVGITADCLEVALFSLGRSKM